MRRQPASHPTAPLTGSFGAVRHAWHPARYNLLRHDTRQRRSLLDPEVVSEFDHAPHGFDDVRVRLAVERFEHADKVVGSGAAGECRGQAVRGWRGCGGLRSRVAHPPI